MEYLQRIARTRRQLIADVEGSEPETAGILLAHIDELGQALNQHYRPAQPRFSDDKACPLAGFVVFGPAQRPRLSASCLARLAAH